MSQPMPPPGWQPPGALQPPPSGAQPAPGARKPLWARWWLWVAIAAAAVVAVVAVVVGTRAVHHSTLSADDQQFCSEQSGRLKPARDALDDIVNGDRHWSSTGEVFAVSQVDITPAYRYLWAQRVQDGTLAGDVKAAGDALFEVELELNSSDPDAGFANDAAKSRTALQALKTLGSFCDDNG